MDIDDFKVVLTGIFITLVVLFVVSVFTIGIMYAIDKPICSNIETQTGYPTKFELFGGCFIQVKDNWIPLDNWRYIEE